MFDALWAELTHRELVFHALADTMPDYIPGSDPELDDAIQADVERRFN